MSTHKRQMCPTCHYPQSTCLCAWVSPISSPLNIIILQHPKEAKHAKNTVKLLTLGIKNITVLQGEEPQDWLELAQKVTSHPQNYSLFFPHEQSTSIESISKLEQKTRLFPNNHHVIFIDASWRKALRIWHLNPWLQHCASWHFDNPPDNQYHIRSTTVKSSLSTLEAVAYVLEYIHHTDCTGLHTLLATMQQKCFLHKANKNS